MAPKDNRVIMLGLIYHPPCRNNKQGVDDMLTNLVTAVDSIHSNQPQAGIFSVVTSTDYHFVDFK